MRYALLLLVAALAGCKDQGPDPLGSITFRPDAASCTGSALVELFVDGAQVGAATLAAGASSEPFPVAPGSHVVSAFSTTSFTEWDDDAVEVTSNANTTVVLPCSFLEPLAPHTINLTNRLLSDVVLTLPNWGVDTMAAAASTSAPTSAVLSFAQTSSMSWRPVAARYSDGTPIPDDNLIGVVNLATSAAATFRAQDVVGDLFYTFALTNQSGAALEIAVVSIASPRCLVAIPATNATYRLGYFVLRSSSEVRLYRSGSGCTGPYVYWDASRLQDRDVQSGYIALNTTIAP